MFLCFYDYMEEKPYPTISEEKKVQGEEMNDNKRTEGTEEGLVGSGLQQV